MADTPTPCRILVLASGNGSNFQALIDAIAARRIPDSAVARLIVNRSKAYATKRAEQHGIPWEYFNLISHGFQAKNETDPAKVQEARDRYDAALADRILGGGDGGRPDLIVCAGWMYVFGENFLRPIQEAGVTIINLHPALPGRYDGTHAIERAFDDFQAGRLEGNKTGIMVHHVIRQIDRGEPIMTQEIECREGENLDQLQDRIHSHEHRLIVEATAKVVGEILDKRK